VRSDACIRQCAAPLRGIAPGMQRGPGHACVPMCRARLVSIGHSCAPLLGPHGAPRWKLCKALFTAAPCERAAHARPAVAARAPAPSACVSRRCCMHARSQRAPPALRRIGSQFLGKYSDSVPAAFVYPSSNFEDDLAWGASWLFRKTGEQHFLAVRARRPDGPARSAGGARGRARHASRPAPAACRAPDRGADSSVARRGRTGHAAAGQRHR